MPPTTSTTPTDEAPPILGSWPNLYAFVLIVHVVLITVFYLASLTYA